MVEGKGIRKRRELDSNFPWIRTPPYWGFQSYSHCRSPETVRRKYTSSEDYFKELRSWLQQAYFWQSVTAHFPYYLMSQQTLFNQPVISLSTNRSSHPSGPVPRPTPAAQGQEAAQNQREVIDGLECRIPPLWKRIVAEVTDFFILFFLKFAVIYVALNVFDIIELEKILNEYEDSIFEHQTLLKMSERLVIFELLHRVVACLFETVWLKGGTNGRLGGASPGKTFMRLRVVRCKTVTPLDTNNNPNDQGMVVVRPGTDLGLGISFLRAAIKNSVLTFLMPTLFYFSYNRRFYDKICNTIVIEEPIRVHRPHQD
ncbi:protein FAM8A1 [Cimex lectularius]|uniref:RDD domain-containing protein n=1 Tax=Cimex lectularius TaxID=79782 RepID=A0A8I6R9K5_CIMLE|nr:protein FAM8A1 [Cimex lectularius]XP_024080771.1 protein FAM8A1 [Cimex lectularius]